MKTKRTKNCKVTAIVLTVLSWLFCFGLAIGFISYYCGTHQSDTSLKEKMGTIAYGAVFSVITLGIVASRLKDRIRPIVWMLDICLGTYLFGNNLVYLVFAIWILDEYVLYPIARHYRNLYTINKEIDKRE